MHDFAIVGGGIVGLATAAELLLRQPSLRLLLLEKEQTWAAHQSGRNSGVIHSGIYYKPGSLKARLGRDGNLSMAAFCREHGIAHEICGKLIVASTEDEIARLDALAERGRANGIEVIRMTPIEAMEVEPNVRCVAALFVPSTGIADYIAVCERLATVARERGGDLRLGTKLIGIDDAGATKRLRTSAGTFETKFLIGCAGLHSDRVTRLDGADPGARVVPFRGEYYELVPEKRHLVRGLVYPVPDPRFPFLGVHLTKAVDGSVHAGPNAVLAFAREGYGKLDVNVRDLAGIVGYRGFWKIAARFWRDGAAEMARSFSKARFTRSVRAFLPSITDGDLVPAKPGIRAQVITPDGTIVDDFLIVRGAGSLHVCNAPSPAATASLEIARAVCDRIEN
ncbi:MAG: L-2-hydroxyglutarate oxidase [Acidobacteria bacterium]|nr:L-2-hydroxyglutarate oxidase [Acidobacteriota bacterium]